MLSLPLVLALAALHWFGDFYMQSRVEGNGKSSDNWLLTRHVLKYAAVMAVAPYLLVILRPDLLLWAVLWLWVNGLLHWGTDYSTSRWTKKLWGQRMVAQTNEAWSLRDHYEHRFWTVIGFDQLVHMATLYATASLWLV